MLAMREPCDARFLEPRLVGDRAKFHAPEPHVYRRSYSAALAAGERRSHRIDGKPFARRASIDGMRAERGWLSVGVALVLGTQAIAAGPPRSNRDALEEGGFDVADVLGHTKDENHARFGDMTPVQMAIDAEQLTVGRSTSLIIGYDAEGRARFIRFNSVRGDSSNEGLRKRLHLPAGDQFEVGGVVYFFSIAGREVSIESKRERDERLRIVNEEGRRFAKQMAQEAARARSPAAVAFRKALDKKCAALGPNDPAPDGVRVREGNAACFQETYEGQQPADTRYFTPSSEVTAEVARELAPRLGATRYFRQYIGVAGPRGRAVWIHGFCDWLPQAELRARPQTVDDGGTCFFEARYDLDAHRLVDFQFHGEA
jgi:hypothetical protein